MLTCCDLVAEDLASVTRSREEENERLLVEIDVYRDDIDKIMDTFRHREGELIDEIESRQQKNNILSNLLDLVTDRAESAQKELDKAAMKEGDERSPSVVSCISDVSSGSDDVFAAAAAQSHRAEVVGETVVVKDWQVRTARAHVIHLSSRIIPSLLIGSNVS